MRPAAVHAGAPASPAHGEPARKFHTLDAMRGTAAIGVALMHWSKIGGQGWMPSGYLAVDLFFAISGFVIAYAYDQRIAAGLGTRRFMTIRLIRLYPLYLLGTLVSVASIVAGIDTGWSAAGLRLALVFALLMLPLPLQGGEPIDDHGTLYPLNDPAWSLLFELLVNLVFVIVHRWLTPRLLIAVLFLAAAALIVSTHANESLERGWAWDGFSVGAARVAFSFPAGVLIYRLYRSGGLPVLRIPAWVVLALLVAVMALPANGMPREAIRDAAIVLFVLPLLLVLGVMATQRPVAQPLFDWLGVISYPLYALHGPLWAMIGGIAAARGIAGEAIPAMLQISLLLLLVAACTPLTRRFDVPIRRWLTSRLVATKRLR